MQPNIIFILTDHFRRDAIGKSTPNLNKLADRGVLFTNAYSAAPLCQPARACIITGMYPSQHGICGNQTPPIKNELRDDTFMRRLQEAGYYTSLIGKHHYIDRYGLGVDVTEDDEEIRRYGFDEVCQVVDDGENTHNQDEYTKHLERLGKLDEYKRVFAENAWACKPHPFEADDTADGFIGVKGVGFIRDYSRDQPFYLNLSFVGPHPPFWHPGELNHSPDDMPPPFGVPDSAQNRKLRAHFMEKCALIDRYVGQLLEVLEQRQLLENTIIIFSSDHGENAGDFGIWDKRYYYEQSCGVPLIMCGPGLPQEERMNGRRVSKALVSHVDLYTTICAMADIPLPPDRKRVGVNLLEVLQNAPGSGHEEIHAELGTSVMIRRGQWKLVFDPQAGGVQQLFNLAVDPCELSNLAGVAGYEGKTLELIERVLSHQISLRQFSHIKEEQRLQSVHIP